MTESWFCKKKKKTNTTVYMRRIDGAIERRFNFK